MLMTPKKCMLCEKFVKLKEFKELRSKFHNWCEQFERPVALCKCDGSELAKKYLEGNPDISKLDSTKVYEALKLNIHHY